MIEWERTDGSIPRSQRAARSGCPSASSPTLVGFSLRKAETNESAPLRARIVARPHGTSLHGRKAETQVADKAAGKRAATMRGRNEDDPANFRNAFVAERLPEEQAIFLRAGDLVDRQVGDGLP